jgi:6-phosphogluconolactonase (cycloisomerase 2 family)
MKESSLISYAAALFVSLFPLQAVAQFAYGFDPTTPGFYGFRTDQKGNFTALANTPFGGNVYYGAMIADTKSDALYVYDASEDNPSIQSYKVDTDGNPTLVYTLPYTPPSVPDTFSSVYLPLISPSGKDIYVVNVYTPPGELSYTTIITVLSIQKNGSITYDPNEGYDLNGGVQAIAEDPSGKFIFGCLGTENYTFGYSVAEDGSLTAISCPQLPDGAVAGTLGFGPQGKYLYEFFQITNESPLLAVYRVESNGALSAIPGSPFSDSQGRFNCDSEFVVDPNSKFAYALGTIESVPTTGIYAFQFESDGRLTPISGSPYSLVQKYAIETVILMNPGGNFITVNSGFSDNWVFEVQPNGALKERENSPSTNIPAINCFVGSK